MMSFPKRQRWCNKPPPCRSLGALEKTGKRLKNSIPRLIPYLFTHKPMQHESTFLTRNYRDHHAAVFSRPSCGKSLFGAYGCAVVYAVRFNFSWEQAISKSWPM